MLNMIFIFLRCPFKLLRIFKDGVYRILPRVMVRFLAPTNPPTLCRFCIAMAAPPTVVSDRVRKLICMRVTDIRRIPDSLSKNNALTTVVLDSDSQFASNPGCIGTEQ